MKVTEDSYAEEPALEWLEEVGWGYVSGTTLAPDLAPQARSIARDVVLRETLSAAIARLNPELPPDEVTRVTELAMTGSHPEVVRDHQDFHRALLEGVPISWLDGDGIERSGRAALVDFEDPAHNEFTAVNQLTIEGGGKVVRRPDVLLYVNGLPLAQIELKNPAGHAGPKEAANQVAHYRDTIPDLYRYVEVIGVSDLLRARVGTITTGPSHFAEWKTMDPEAMEGRTQLEVLIREVFTPAGLLDLVRNFVLFETDGARTWKILAKYHQVDAVNRAVEATADAMAGDGRAGVVWHTQGAGKSYSMVFYVTKLRRDRRFENPTVVCVTDTNDLDNQLSETFARQTDLRDAVTQADSISKGQDSLYKLLDVPAGGIVFTTIQKFGRGKDEPEMPVISNRRNVVVIADEAHRSQYDTLARNLMRDTRCPTPPVSALRARRLSRPTSAREPPSATTSRSTEWPRRRRTGPRCRSTTSRAKCPWTWTARSLRGCRPRSTTSRRRRRLSCPASSPASTGSWAHPIGWIGSSTTS